MAQQGCAPMTERSTGATAHGSWETRDTFVSWLGLRASLPALLMLPSRAQQSQTFPPKVSCLLHSGTNLQRGLTARLAFPGSTHHYACISHNKIFNHSLVPASHRLTSKRMIPFSLNGKIGIKFTAQAWSIYQATCPPPDINILFLPPCRSRHSCGRTQVLGGSGYVLHKYLLYMQISNN